MYLFILWERKDKHLQQGPLLSLSLAQTTRITVQVHTSSMYKETQDMSPDFDMASRIAKHCASATALQWGLIIHCENETAQ